MSIPLSYEYDLDKWSTYEVTEQTLSNNGKGPEYIGVTDQVMGQTLSNNGKASEYIGIDVRKLFLKTSARFTSKKDFMNNLGRALTVTFKRGCNLKKVFIRNPTRVKFKDALKKLGVVRVTNPGPDVLTLGRLAMLCPTTHPIWLSKGKEPAHKVFFPSLPRPSHCTSFAASVPPGLNWDPYFFAGILYNVYFDTIINPFPKIPATVQQVVNYCKSGREAKVIKDADKARYMAIIGCTETLAMELGWCQGLVEGVLMLPCKVAWAQLRRMIDRQPPFGTDTSPNSPESRDGPEDGASLIVTKQDGK